MLPQIIMSRSIHILRKCVRAHDHTLTFVIKRKCKEQNWSKNDYFKVLFQVHLFAEISMKLNGRNYRLLKIFDRKCRFIFSLFMVYFSVVSKWCWFFVYHFRAINCPKLFPILLSSRFTKIYWIQNWPK